MTEVKCADYVPLPTWRGRVHELPDTCRLGWAVWYDDGNWCRYVNEEDARGSARYWKGQSWIFYNGKLVEVA